jgi:hypothetical protein
MSKVRDAIMNAVAENTRKFNLSIFPQADPSWTPEQLAVYEYLNGESGGITAVHESHRAEITKNLTRFMGLYGMKSRFTAQDEIKVPPYTIIVLRESMEGYPSGFPIIKSRLSGYWTEKGQGSSSDMSSLCVKHIRPATEDDINKLTSKFPEQHLHRLYGAAPFAEKKFRKVLIENITKRTDEFASEMKAVYPEGITDKGLAILQLDLGTETLKAMSIVLDDPKILEDYHRPPTTVTFLPYVAIYMIDDHSGSVYTNGRVHVQAGIVSSHDLFFTYPDEGRLYGNHHEATPSRIRAATHDEITKYIKELPDDRLHMYAEALMEEQLESLL